jgi:hypothetical protein
LGILGILEIENRKPNIFFLSFPTGNNYQKNYLFLIIIFFDHPHCVRADALGSAWTQQPIRADTREDRGAAGASERARGEGGRSLVRVDSSTRPRRDKASEGGRRRELVRMDVARIHTDARLGPRGPELIHTDVPIYPRGTL